MLFNYCNNLETTLILSSLWPDWVLIVGLHLLLKTKRLLPAVITSAGCGLRIEELPHRRMCGLGETQGKHLRNATWGFFPIPIHIPITDKFLISICSLLRAESSQHHARPALPSALRRPLPLLQLSGTAFICCLMKGVAGAICMHTAFHPALITF